MAPTNDLRDIEPCVAELILFLQEGPKTDSEILAGIPEFKNDTLGKAISLGLVEHCYPLVWLTNEGERLAAALIRLLKIL